MFWFLKTSIHLSLYPISKPHNRLLGCREPGVCPRRLWARGSVHPGQHASLQQGTLTHSHSPTTYFLLICNGHVFRTFQILSSSIIRILNIYTFVYFCWKLEVRYEMYVTDQTVLCDSKVSVCVCMPVWLVDLSTPVKLLRWVLSRPDGDELLLYSLTSSLTVMWLLFEKLRAKNVFSGIQRLSLGLCVHT